MWVLLVLSDVLLFCSMLCSFSCFVAGSDCVAEFRVFQFWLGNDACEVVYIVLYMVRDIQWVVMGVVCMCEGLYKFEGIL